MGDPTRGEMLSALAGHGDEFEIEEAIYWVASDYHGGQSSNLYAALCASPYKPGACSQGPEHWDLYRLLVEEFEP